MTDSSGEPKISGRLQDTADRIWTGTRTAMRPVNRNRWVGIILLFVVLEIAVLSIERAQWITPQPQLTLVLILSMLATWLLGSAGRIHILFRHAAILITGGLITLWQATSVTSFGQGTIYFAIFLVYLVWAIGYVSTWFYLKKRNAWAAVILGAVAVLVNLSNLPGQYYYFFGTYFVVAVIFIVQNRIFTHGVRSGNSSSNRNRGLRYFMAVLAVISILAVCISWVMPVLKLPQLETWVATRTLWTNEIKESSFNFFAYVMAKQPRATSSAKRYLDLGSGWHQRENIHFIVHSERPAYWQVYIYDEYTSEGWVNSSLDSHMLDENTSWESNERYLKQSTITNTVETGLKTDMLLTAGEFTSSDTSVIVHENDGEVLSVTTPRLLKPGESYEITSRVTSATPEDLAAAGNNYPQNITDNYLQLPAEFPEIIETLTENITKEAITPYDRVMAIDRYLASFAYEEEVVPAPAGTDSVEYFLTTSKSGFCTYFASAMAVMLRSVDVPSRLVVGYLPGEPGENEDEYILRDKHYHAWPQVFFPNYGWVNIEATPGSANSQATEDVPVVSSPGVQAGGQSAVTQWWEIPYWQSWQLATTDNAPRQIEKSSRWAFADILGKTITGIFMAVLAGSLVAVVLFGFRSRFYRWIWRVVRADPARNVYLRLCELGALANIGPAPQQTPLEYSAMLSAEFPDEADAINGIARSYMDNQFGCKESRLDLAEEAELLKARRVVFNAILKRLGFFSKIVRRSF